jgi:succinate dehydrogenase / fumarate reductase flavoprotein subunit
MVRELRQEFWGNLKVPGNDRSYNLNLQKAGRLADFLELGELMAIDALDRKESCGGHLREESQSDEGEAIRDDENFCHVSAWEYKGEGVPAELYKEPLVFENVELTQRSYK